MTDKGRGLGFLPFIPWPFFYFLLYEVFTLLSDIHSPEDIKNLSYKELENLSSDIRKAIIDVVGNKVCDELWRGYTDDVYEELNNLAQGEIIIATNKYFGNFMSTLLECIMSYYGGENLLKIAPSLCILSSNIRANNTAPGHRIGRAFDFDYGNNLVGSWKSGKSYFKVGRDTFYKGFFEIIKASKHGNYPVKTKEGFDDPMHFQWLPR